MVVNSSRQSELTLRSSLPRFIQCPTVFLLLGNGTALSPIVLKETITRSSCCNYSILALKATLKGHLLRQFVHVSITGTTASPDSVNAAEFLILSLLGNFELAPTGPCCALGNYTSNSPFFMVENPSFTTAVKGRINCLYQLDRRIHQKTFLRSYTALSSPF